MSIETKKLKKTYLRYLFAGVGSSVISSVYSIVDAIMVGQYEGPNGTAALSVVMPVWTIVFSLGLLFGVGGGALMSEARGANDKKRGDVIFTCALVCVSAVSLAAWAMILFCEEPLLRLFGADETLLPLAKGYLRWLRFFVPLFTMGQFLAAFIRNDNAPARAMAAVITGGVFNIFGDYFFVFVADMGIEGAGLATAIGQTIVVCILCSHFFTRGNGLKLAKPAAFLKHAQSVSVAGFSVFVVDLAMGILAMFFNNQIMKYLGAGALAVYGVIVNVSTLVQSLSYGVGQAAQPIISVKYGAGEREDIRRVQGYGIVTAFILGALAFAVCEILPLPIVRGFMQTTEEIERIAPSILRIYAISFLLLPRNVFFTYYYQAVMRPWSSLFVSLLRGIAVSGVLIFVLPAAFGGFTLWWVMPIAELVTYGAGLLLGRSTSGRGTRTEGL